MATGNDILNLPEAHFQGGSNLSEDDGRPLSLIEILKSGGKAAVFTNANRPTPAAAGAGGRTSAGT